MSWAVTVSPVRRFDPPKTLTILYCDYTISILISYYTKYTVLYNTIQYNTILY